MFFFITIPLTCVCECGWRTTLIIFYSSAAIIIHQIWSTIWYQHIFPKTISTTSHPILYLNFNLYNLPSSIFNLEFLVTILSGSFASNSYYCPCSHAWILFKPNQNVILRPHKAFHELLSWTFSPQNPILFYLYILGQWFSSWYSSNQDTCCILLTSPALFILLVLHMPACQVLSKYVYLLSAWVNIRVKCLTTTYSLSFHCHGHCLLHVHLPGFTTLDKTNKESKEKKAREVRWANMFTSWKINTTARKRLSFDWGLMDKKRIMNIFLLQERHFCSFKTTQTPSECSPRLASRCTSDARGALFAAHVTHFTLIHCNPTVLQGGTRLLTWSMPFKDFQTLFGEQNPSQFHYNTEGRS